MRSLHCSFIHAAIVTLTLVAVAGWPRQALARPAHQGGMRAVWVSPDWLLDGTRTTTAAQARAIVSRTVRAVRDLGANVILLETLLRGQSACLCTGTKAAPPYPLCRLQGAGPGDDIVGLFVKEARSQGLQVHAWVHLFYWKSDNMGFRKPWHDGPSLFDDLLVDYLGHVSQTVKSLPRRRAAAQFALELGQGYSRARWEALVTRWGLSNFEGPMQALIRFLEAGGAPPPDFLLTNPKGDPHGPIETDRVLSLYVDPEFPAVRERLAGAITHLFHAHPELDGLHLDHARYPKGAFASASDLSKFPAGMRTIDYKPARWEMTGLAPLLERRTRALTDLVTRIRDGIPSGKTMSSAVYPSYYPHKDSPTDLVAPEEFLCQDWARWPISYAIPMIYGVSSGKVDQMTGQARSSSSRHGGGDGPRVFPGVSSRDLVRHWGHGRDWALFDFDGLADLIGGVPGSPVRTMGLGEKIW